MLSCECGKPVHVRKTGECQSCYNKAWRSRAAERSIKCHCGEAVLVVKSMLCATHYARSRVRSPEAVARHRERQAQKRHDARLVALTGFKDPTYADVLLAEVLRAFYSRERHLAWRREWNFKNKEKRAAYRRKHNDSTKPERNARQADRREQQTGRRSHPNSRVSTPERLARQREWRAANRDYVNAQARCRRAFKKGLTSVAL